MSRFRLDPGFRIELMASEPDIQSPIAMDIDEHGRWFVLEMPGYPVDTRPTGRVKLLEDTDGDGRPNKSTVFADGLVLPSGIMRWRRGVIVTSAPDILYLEDRDGDGKADRREVLVTGFAVTNPQHRINTPLYGLDNWIYFAHEGPAEAVIYTDTFGDLGRPLTQPRFPDRPPVKPERRSVRLRPDTGDLEAIAGQSQYGQAFDAWGHYFGSNNSDHMRLEMLREPYLARNPDLPIDAAMAEISDHGQNAKVFPITDHPTFELLTESGEFTSACSLTPYTGGLFSGSYARSTFVAEPVHNLVHRDVLEPEGSTLRARRGSEGREFLASTDSWFRPVAFYIGPDGALYVIDYYRKRIEHPEWTASEFQKDPSESPGAHRGRIDRVVPDGARPATASPALDTASTAILSPRWKARTSGGGAPRSGCSLTASTGRRAAADFAGAGPRPSHARPPARALDARRARTTRQLAGTAGIERSRAGSARERAADGGCAAGEGRFACSGRRRSREQGAGRRGAVPAARDAGVSARRRCRGGAVVAAVRAHRRPMDAARGADRRARARGAIPDARARPGFDGHDNEHAWPPRLLFRNGRRDWCTTRQGRAPPRHRRNRRTARRLGRVVAGLAALRASRWSWQRGRQSARGGARIAGESRGSQRRVPSESVPRPSPRDRAPAAATATAAVARAERLSADRTVSGARRADAIRLLGIAGAVSRETSLLVFVNPREPEAVQIAAIESLRSIKGIGIARELLPRWAELTPGARLALADLMLTEPDRQRLLVEALKGGTCSRGRSVSVRNAT